VERQEKLALVNKENNKVEKLTPIQDCSYSAVLFLPPHLALAVCPSCPSMQWCKHSPDASLEVCGQE